MAASVTAHSPKVEIEPPGLELDLGYSIIEARPSIKLKISLGAFSRKNSADRFALPLRKWWVKLHGRTDGKAEIINNQPHIRTAFEEEITRERQVKTHDISSMAEVDLAESRKAMEILRPERLVSNDVVQRIRSQALGWLKLFKEALIQARDEFIRAENVFKDADKVLDSFVSDKRLNGRSPPARRDIWNRIAALAGMVTIEALLSLPPVAEHQDGRIVLSFLYPLSVSIANAILGVLTGAIGLYQIKHSEKPSIRAAAGVACVVSLVLALWMNFSVARWREGSGAAESVMSLLPQTALSKVLLVIGLSVYVFAIYKGLREFSDGYPGHDEKWDEFKRTEEDYQRTQARYLHLVHEMRRSSQEKLDSVRAQLTVIRVEHEKRKKLAAQMIIDLQALERILPGYYERLNSSTRILLKLYRQSGFQKRKAMGNAAAMLAYPELEWNTPLPDVAGAKTEADRLATVIDNNLLELSRFEDRFEREIAAEIDREIEAVAAEAKTSNA